MKIDPTVEARAKLCPELRALLEVELAAGNVVVECMPGWMRGEGIFALLRAPFMISQKNLPTGVEQRDINDPHWWKTEYFHAESKDCLACKF